MRPHKYIMLILAILLASGCGGMAGARPLTTTEICAIRDGERGGAYEARINGEGITLEQCYRVGLQSMRPQEPQVLIDNRDDAFCEQIVAASLVNNTDNEWLEMCKQFNK